MALAALCAILLAACGGDDGNAGGGLYGSGQAGTETETGPAQQLGEKGGEAAPVAAQEAAPEEETGEGDEPVGLSPRRAIRISLTAVLAGGHPQTACGSFVTGAYLDTAFGGRGGCVAAQAPMAVAKSIEVRSIEVAGSEATAVAVPKGGVLDAQTLTVALVHRGGVWKVDSLRSDVPVGP